MTEQQQHQQQWYVRRGSTIQGPYDVDQLRRYLLLGRVRLTDRASPDGEHWYALTQCAELIPEEMCDLESEEGRERFEAARRAADERDAGGSENLPIPGERVDDLPLKLSWSRWALLGLAVVVAASLVLVGLYGNVGAGSTMARDCSAAAAPRVNWNYCAMEGLTVPPGTNLGGATAVNAVLRDAELAGVGLVDANLSYADLSGANLRGSDLTGADLTGADLRGADLGGTSLVDANLEHADLRGARIEGAQLEGTQLEHAVWIDGRPCVGAARAHCRS